MEHSVILFANGYGASIIPGRFSGEWELAVVKPMEPGRYTVVTDTPVTGDVIRFDDSDDIMPILSAIAAL